VRFVRLHPEAEAELAAEVQYYEEQLSDLGKRFADEVESAVKLAATFPQMGAPYKLGTRRVFTRKFPFSIVYQIFPEEIVILAIAPFARKAAYWRQRRTHG